MTELSEREDALGTTARPSLHVFGGLRLAVDGETRPLGGPQERAVLALLVANADHPVSVDRLLDALWGDEVPATAEKTIQVYMSRIRAALGPAAVDRSAVGYVLHTVVVDLDVGAFEAAVRTGNAELEAGDAARADAAFDEALAIAAGEPFPDVAEVVALAPEIARLVELRWQAATGRFDAGLRLGRHEALVVEIEAAVAQQPHRERAWAQLMLALYRSGRQAEALAAYHRARLALDEELGIEPGPELRDLERRILDQDPGLALPVALQSRGVPHPISSIVGRTDDLRRLASTVADHRLSTLVGPGGVGKTRLAIEAANQLTPEFTDGSAFIGLADVTDHALVPTEILTVLGVRPPPDRAPLDVLTAYLGARRMLLVIDNLEQIPDISRPVGALLDAAPNVHILATSRRPIAVRGETTLTVDPLTVAAGDRATATDAARLFIERAADVRPQVPGPEALATIESICGRLDGLPLAIELVARLTRVMEVAEIDRELAALALGVEGTADLPERHRTLRATIQWSRKLLPPDAQRSFPLLGLFSGGFDREAFEAALRIGPDAGRSTAILAALIDHSLVRRTASRAGVARFAVLDMIRSAAREELAGDDRRPAVETAIASHYLEVATASETLLDGPEQVTAMDRLDAELDNIRTSIQTAIRSGLAEQALLAAAALRPFWERSGRFAEGRATLAAVLELRDSAPPAAVGKAVNAAGVMAWLASDYPAARMAWESALDMRRQAGDVTGAMYTLGNLGILATDLQDFDRARWIYTECLETATALGDSWGLAAYHGNLGQVEIETGRLPEGELHIREAIDRFREIGDDHSVAMALNLQARAALAAGRLDEAEALERESLRLGEAVDNWNTKVIAHRRLALIAALADRPEETADELRAAGALVLPADDAMEICELLETFSRGAARRDPGGAARALGAADRIRRRTAKQLWPLDAPIISAARGAAEAGLGTETFAAAYAAGAAADPKELLIEVLGMVHERRAGSPADGR
jgi:predicted ATPase/DNA-binding SARP family transcriptional activator